MKITTIFLWAINALFAGYLVMALQGTSALQNQHYQGIERGISLMGNLRNVVKTGIQESFKQMYKDVNEEGNRPYDIAYLKKAKQIITLQDTLDKKLSLIIGDSGNLFKLITY